MSGSSRLTPVFPVEVCVSGQVCIRSFDGTFLIAYLLFLLNAGYNNASLISPEVHHIISLISWVSGIGPQTTRHSLACQILLIWQAGYVDLQNIYAVNTAYRLTLFLYMLLLGVNQMSACHSPSPAFGSLLGRQSTESTGQSILSGERQLELHASACILVLAHKGKTQSVGCSSKNYAAPNLAQTGPGLVGQ